MNIGEANAWFEVMKGLESTSTPEQAEKAVAAAAELTRRANATLNAGPRPDQIEVLVDATIVATWEQGDVALHERTIQTATVPGDRL